MEKVKRVFRTVKNIFAYFLNTCPYKTMFFLAIIGCLPFNWEMSLIMLAICVVGSIFLRGVRLLLRGAE
ncbi:hypothetical protein [Ruminococcus gauvreauii]|uniref:Uncharacterized protein n=1 Tax=Ruminococcus gauvreauii TaxID=438033 RepID=A0ABY5VJB6_9FIRM|nr:hypothetical protein [Ruminococcus gauvreauii]UWP60432.1 hypothetical protein NQ502_05160 [Ruminococcus gauvreauii]